MIERFIIKGGERLKGEIKVEGAKNFALKLLPASLLTDQEWTISNVPQIEDIFRMIELLQSVGADVKNPSKKIYCLKTKKITTTSLSAEHCKGSKASILICASLLARCGKVFFARPGGCAIGPRPHDIFWAGFKALGVKLKRTQKGYYLTTKGLKGAKFVFPWISILATEAMILAGVMAKGKTVLRNAACEPEIVALVRFLNQCGAKIKGAGTHSIEIEGVESLSGGKCRVIPDRIEAGSFIILGLVVKSPIKITGLNPDHLEALFSSLHKAGVKLEIGKDFVQIENDSWKNLQGIEVRTHEYPGFPTDLQSPFTVLMTQAKGLSLIHETIFEKRLLYTDMLNQMGARIIMCDPHRVIIQGPSQLYGRHLISPDIRAGIALVIAALAARDESTIENIYQIDRGYEQIEKRLRGLGAKIQRVASFDKK